MSTRIDLQELMDEVYALTKHCGGFVTYCQNEFRFTATAYILPLSCDDITITHPDNREPFGTIDANGKNATEALVKLRDILLPLKEQADDYV